MTHGSLTHSAYASVLSTLRSHFDRGAALIYRVNLRAQLFAAVLIAQGLNLGGRCQTDATARTRVLYTAAEICARARSTDKPSTNFTSQRLAFPSTDREISAFDGGWSIGVSRTT